MRYPETPTQQVLRLILAIHCARLWPLPDNPLNPGSNPPGKMSKP